MVPREHQDDGGSLEEASAGTGLWSPLASLLGSARVLKALADPTAAATADGAELNESEMSRRKSRHSCPKSHSL